MGSNQFVLTCFLAIAVAARVQAADTFDSEKPAPDEEGTFNFNLENDEIAGTDRHYTNGVEFSYLSSPLERNSNWRFGVAIGHQLFTPQDTDTTLPQPADQPYAGYLYGGLALVVDHGSQLDTFVVNLGTIGPDAHGEELQNDVHRLIDSDRSNGWANQLDNEITYQGIYEHRWRGVLQTKGGFLGADLSPHLGASVGNVAGYANAGLTFRFGNDLRDDYGVPRIRPSLPGSGFFTPKDGFGWYAFAGVDGRYVWQNIFLDGNSDGNSLSVDKKRWVYDVQAGLALTFRRVRFAYTYVYRSKEFETQTANDRFGAVSISARF
ncbi:MAG: lipid A deacylase LpxR family protein [Steroidobacteraceae bacterium]